jgi:hypothetical protein
MPDEWDGRAEDTDEEPDEIAPGDPDYDLSEAHGWDWEPKPARNVFLSPLVLMGISLLLVLALLLPALVTLTR